MKSPLKPSNESLLEHYKYEKQSKSSAKGGSSATQQQLQDLMAQGEGILSHHGSANKSAHKNNLVVEEPKIISMTSSFGQ